MSLQFTQRDAEAHRRLVTWADPRAVGNPTKRMMKIWNNPKDMAVDLGYILEFISKLHQANT